MKTANSLVLFALAGASVLTAACDGDPTSAKSFAGKDGLVRVSQVFFNLASTESSEELRQVERDISPLLARHRSAIFLDAKLLARIEAIMSGPEWGLLNAEQKRLTERVRKGFVRAGARQQ